MIAFKVKYHRYTTLATLLLLGVYSPTVLLGAYIGSALPDADTRYSGIGRILPLWFFVKKKNRNNVHRKVTHSLFFIITTYFLASFISFKFSIGILVGVALHVFADSTTMVGVPYLLWPVKYNPNHPYFTGELFKEGTD